MTQHNNGTIDKSISRPKKCTREYRPVCGYYFPSIDCDHFPCTKEFSNRCVACAEDNVEYILKGKCPTPKSSNDKKYCPADRP